MTSAGSARRLTCVMCGWGYRVAVGTDWPDAQLALCQRSGPDSCMRVAGLPHAHEGATRWNDGALQVILGQVASSAMISTALGQAGTAGMRRKRCPSFRHNSRRMASGLPPLRNDVVRPRACGDGGRRVRGAL